MSIISMDSEKEKRIIDETRVDKEKFAPIYIHYKKYILDFFSYRVSDSELHEELTAKTFEKALNGIDNFQWQGVSFSAWLYRIARNTLIDYYRGNKKRSKTSSLDESFNIEATEETPHEHVETVFAEELLYKVIKELPSREKEIIYLKFFDGYTNRVIAQITGLTETNVGTIVYRAVNKLRKMYLEEFN